MPTYEYLCKNCGVIEVIQKITEEALKKCPQCENDVVRLISVTGKPQFKGKGFYETDYKQKDK